MAVVEQPDDAQVKLGAIPSGVILQRAAGVRPIQPGYLILKRTMDLALCFLAIPIVIPLMGICAMLIWLDGGGNVFFTQMRTGRAGRRFRMFKFRTMVINSEELKEKYRHLNELKWPDFKISDDPRMTRVGRFLRKTSLDEVPQIINVLRGDMSWVGPRPTSFDVSTYDLQHTERLEVQPGITGLWQISGRADVDFDERTRLDVEYIERRSIWLDIRILFATVATVIRRDGAY